MPRSNLVLDDAYNDFVYGTPKAGAGGRSLNDIHNECIEDKRNFKPYFSKSHVVKAFMTAPSTLLYTVKHNRKNFDKVREISKDYVRVWLDMALGEDPGRKRVRNSQLQRLISRSFSARFG